MITGTFTMTGLTAGRISGFTFNIGTDYCSVEWSTGFRIDHNTFTHAATSDFAILTYGDSTIPIEGLIDHNTFTNGKVVYFGSHGGAGAGAARWAEPLNVGTSHALYVEDNTFNLTDVDSYNNSIDGNWGCRYVVRFNTFLNGRIEQHSLQGDDQRGCRLWELYNNTMTNPLWQNYRPYFIRAGTGMVFHNTSDGQFLVNEIDIDNARSEEGSIAPQVPIFGFCDGTSFVDGNTSGQQGWPCRDQIGRSTDASLWNYSNPAPAQASAPAYLWRNTQPGGEMPTERSCESADARCTRQNTLQILESRDYYTYRSSFDGTVGIGEGVFSAIPATCTVGVGYWATDQGEWNRNNPGADGRLYVCGPTNTWTVAYTPYTYPHPLQGGTSGGGSSSGGSMKISGTATIQ